MNKTPEWHRQNEAAIRREIDNGLRNSEIVTAMRFSGSAAPWERRQLAEYVADVRRRYLGSGRPPSVSGKDVLAAVRKHGSNRAAARALGFSEGTVRNRLRELDD